MITVITGVPGSGKTALCVEKMLLPTVGKSEKAIDANGKHVEIVRKIWTNINGLLIDHEKIDHTHLNTWHEWAKPGDLIVFDEVQEHWPLKATGSAKPDYIQKLETHRHMGVDFILMTQHPMLVDASIARLAGRHLHVRRLGNSRFATVYEWDGLSRTLLYKNSMAKSPWRRSKKAEQSYRSAALHTVQKRKAPALLWGVAFGVIALCSLSPYVYGRIQDRVNPPPIAHNAPAAPQRPASAPGGPQRAPTPQTAPMPLVSASGAVERPVAYAGCVAMRGVCKCFANTGAPVEKEPEFCASVVGTDRREKLAALPGSLVEHRTPVAPGAWIGFSDAPKPYHLTIGDVVATYHKP